MNYNYSSDFKKQRNNIIINLKNSSLNNNNYNFVNTPLNNNVFNYDVKNYSKDKLASINKLKICKRNITRNFYPYKMEFGYYDKYFLNRNINTYKLLNYMNNKKNKDNYKSANNTDIHNKTVKKINHNNNEYKDKRKQIEQINIIINKIKNHECNGKQEKMPITLNKIY